ncbi:MAG TPA: hypothetical protein VEJ45_05100 [Candidatus Acidoferrales bacterium]|nr:hypothetical protein [Candidatus Acidoferrales bacterium]
MGKGKAAVARMALLLAAGLVCSAGDGGDQVFRGEIADSQCALNVHSLSRSHEEMLKKHEIGTTAGECARYCVKNLGGVFVLQAKDKVYKLDDQKVAQKNAGLKVKVTGLFDPETNIITVHTMEPLKDQ